LLRSVASICCCRRFSLVRQPLSRWAISALTCFSPISATVEIPGAELDDYGRAKVEQALARFTVGGVEYRLIGASGSAKSGRYYAVSKEYEKPIAGRFQQWPEAAVTYFGILVLTNDCRRPDSALARPARSPHPSHATPLAPNSLTPFTNPPRSSPPPLTSHRTMSTEDFACRRQPFYIIHRFRRPLKAAA
jgi:hypothetical protein